MLRIDRRQRRKLFLIKKSRKAILLLKKNNKSIRRRRNFDNEYGVNRAAKPNHLSGKRHVLTAPETFGLFKDSESTLRFFSDVNTTISACQYKDNIFFDLSQVKTIEPDAVMYLIAILRNTKRIRRLEIHYGGNFPDDPNARAVIDQAGFYSYVQYTSLQKVETTTACMRISSGDEADNLVASSFCDFVQRTFNKTIIDTKQLYPMIIELMTNTHQHAYHVTKQEIMRSNWYIFAHMTAGVIHFLFIDTGAGIPKTVYKRFVEKAIGYVKQNDAKYIESALVGEFRTETKQHHRGKGLPGIREDAQNHVIENLCIVSGRGMCRIENGNIISQELNEPFEGTLFSWDINNEEVA